MHIKERLDLEVKRRNNPNEVSQKNLDPILVAHRYRDPTISLICALFALGQEKIL